MAGEQVNINTKPSGNSGGETMVILQVILDEIRVIKKKLVLVVQLVIIAIQLIAVQITETPFLISFLLYTIILTPVITKLFF